jgi:hypothetical protein
MESAGGAEIDLDPLLAGPKLDEVAVFARFLAVGHEAKLPDDRLHITGRDPLVERIFHLKTSTSSSHKIRELAANRLQPARGSLETWIRPGKFSFSVLGASGSQKLNFADLTPVGIAKYDCFLTNW